jgi:hypothetical protein
MHFISDVTFDTGAQRHASKSLSSLLQSIVPMRVSLYRKHMINDVQSFVLWKKQKGYRAHVLRHVRRRLSSFVCSKHFQPVGATSVQCEIKASSNELIFVTIDWKCSMLQEALFPHTMFQAPVY